MRCWNCAHEIKLGSKFCSVCGKPQEKREQADVYFCPSCGSKKGLNDNLCIKCGYQYKDATTQVTTNKSSYQSPYQSSNSVSVLPYASFVHRVGATILDAFVIFIIAFIVILFLYSFTYVTDEGAEILGLLIGLFYKAGMESSKYQGTLGKLAVGIKVTDYHGQRISFLRALGRFFASYLSALLLGIGYLIALFTEKKQTLHDIMAGTIVQKNC